MLQNEEWIEEFQLQAFLSIKKDWKSSKAAQLERLL